MFHIAIAPFVLYIYVYIYIFHFFYFICLKFRLKMPALETNAPVVVRQVFFVSLFLFFRLVTERGRGSTGFSVLSMFLVITTVLCTCIVLTYTMLAYMSLSIRARMRPAHSKSHRDLTSTIHLAEIQCNNGGKEKKLYHSKIVS